MVFFSKKNLLFYIGTKLSTNKVREHQTNHQLFSKKNLLFYIGTKLSTNKVREYQTNHQLFSKKNLTSVKKPT